MILKAPSCPIPDFASRSGNGCRERPCRCGQRADQTVARERRGTRGVAHLTRQERVFDRGMDADSAARRTDGADKRNEGQKGKMLRAWKQKPGGRRKTRRRDQQAAQIEARSDRADKQCQQRRAGQRRGCDQPDRDGIVTDRREISRQDNRGKTVAERTQRGRRKNDSECAGHVAHRFHCASSARTRDRSAVLGRCAFK